MFRYVPKSVKAGTVDFQEDRIEKVSLYRVIEILVHEANISKIWSQEAFADEADYLGRDVLDGGHGEDNNTVALQGTS
jgi:hypothetical protein